MAFGKNGDASIMNDSLMLDQSLMNSMAEESKQGSRSLDPNSIFDPKYIETKKIENLQTLLDNASQIFVLNLCLGVKDPKQIKKMAKADLEKIKEEGA